VKLPVSASLAKARSCQLSIGSLIHEPDSSLRREIREAIHGPPGAGWHRIR
jgi:hypothetical protein